MRANIWIQIKNEKKWKLTLNKSDWVNEMLSRESYSELKKKKLEQLKKEMQELEEE